MKKWVRGRLMSLLWDIGDWCMMNALRIDPEIPERWQVARVQIPPEPKRVASLNDWIKGHHTLKIPVNSTATSGQTWIFGTTFWSGMS